MLVIALRTTRYICVIEEGTANLNIVRYIPNESRNGTYLLMLVTKLRELVRTGG